MLGAQRAGAGLFVLAAVAAVLPLGGCADDDTTPPRASDPVSSSESSEGSESSGTAGDAASNMGVFDDRVVFGQSAAFSGEAEELGAGMRLGIEAAFSEANRAGGVHGRRLELVSLDDRYEPDIAHANTIELVEDESVFAMIGEVGTPTSFTAAPLARDAGVPFLAPFTGAAFLRSGTGGVVNLRASYEQETELMVARLTEDLGFKRIAVLYQNDSYGEDGRAGVESALLRRGLFPVAQEYYLRNSRAVKAPVSFIVDNNPEAVIMIGAYAPVAAAIKETRKSIDPIFMAVSFVGPYALARELGSSQSENVYVTQVVPVPSDSHLGVVESYRQALASHDPEAEPGFVSLEGYLAGRLAIAMLESCGPEPTRQCFADAPITAGAIDIDGFVLEFGPGDNQGSDAVFLTALGPDGAFRLIDRLIDGSEGGSR